MQPPRSSNVGAAEDVRQVDMVLVGAAGLVENGGILNRIGTYEIGLVAKAQGAPPA